MAVVLAAAGVHPVAKLMVESWTPAAFATREKVGGVSITPWDIVAWVLFLIEKHVGLLSLFLH